MITKAQNDAHGKALALIVQMEALADELAGYKAVLEQAGSGKHRTDHGIFQVSENNTYDTEAIESQLTKGQWMRCSERKLSKAMVKMLYPEIYASAKERRGYKVSL